MERSCAKTPKHETVKGVNEAVSSMKYECGKCPSVFKQP